MTEHQILMMAEMVRATLAGRKDMTRRIVTFMNSLPDGRHWSKEDFAKLDLDNAWIDQGPSPAGNPGPYLKAEHKIHKTVHRIYPKYWDGDYLWVKETSIIAPPDWSDNPDDSNIKDNLGRYRTIQYLATNTDTEPAGWYNLKKTPSIFMPKWASRITLEVNSIKPERIQDITPHDARREGLQDMDASITGTFAKLWDGINSKRGPWKDNPWVWVIEFKKV